MIESLRTQKVIDGSGDGCKRGFNNGDSVWLCLTSLWHRRFVEDVIHVVGMPSGTRVRLRYRKEYVEDALWKRALNREAQCKVIVLIALLDAQAVAPPEATPLRCSRLISIGCQGSIMVLDLALDDFIIASPDRNAFWNEAIKKGRNFPGAGVCGEPPTGHFLQELRTAPTSIQRDGSIQAWESVAESVFSIDDHVNGTGRQRHILFLYFVAGLNKELKRSLARHGGLVREGGLPFSLDIHTITRKGTGKILKPLGEICLEVSHPIAKFITSRRIRIDSRRDVKTIQLSTSAVFRRTYGHLSVRSVYFEYPPPDVDDTPCATTRPKNNPPSVDRPDAHSTPMKGANRREETIIARYDFLLVIGRILPWVACATVALAAATAVYEVPDDRATQLADFVHPSVVFLLAFVGLVIGLRGEKD